MTDKKVILVTGANSGLGFACALALAKTPNVHLIAAGRNPQRMREAIAEFKAAASSSSIVEQGIIDMGSLKSVRMFADDLCNRDIHLFSIVCNAGVQAKEKTLTEDGFETTFGVNHLGHFLLVKLLMERTSRVITISSETHDPAEKTGVPTPDVSDLDKLARGYDKFDPLVAYSTSKLCNLLHTKELVRRFPRGPASISYTPGLTMDTGLFRDQNRAVFAIVGPLIKLYTRCIGGRVSTSEYSGGMMARLASEPSGGKIGWKNGDYICVDAVYPASAQACDGHLGKELWDKSEMFVQRFV